MSPPTQPWMTFIFGGPSARPASVSIDYSMDTLSARATCQFPGDTRQASGSYFPAVEINQHCWLQGGYQGISNDQLFDGFIEDDGSKYARTSLANTLTLGDKLRLMQYPAGDPFVQPVVLANQAALFDSTLTAAIDPATGLVTLGGPSITNNGVWDDISIAKALLVRGGLGAGNLGGVGGTGVLMAQRQGIVLTNQETPEALLTRVDQATGCKTFSTPNGVVRTPTTFTPGGGAVWTLRQGFEILEIENLRSTRKFYNRVIVLGTKVGQGQIISVRSAPPNLPQPPGGGGNLLYGRPGNMPITKTYTSDMIQSQDMADRLSANMLAIGNRIERRFTIKTAFESKAQPGQTVAVFAPAVKIYSTINCFVLGFRHSLDSSGAFTTWTVAVYDGVSGPADSSPPFIPAPAPIVGGPFVSVG